MFLDKKTTLNLLNTVEKKGNNLQKQVKVHQGFPFNQRVRDVSYVMSLAFVDEYLYIIQSQLYCQSSVCEIQTGRSIFSFLQYRGIKVKYP